MKTILSLICFCAAAIAQPGGVGVFPPPTKPMCTATRTTNCTLTDVSGTTTVPGTLSVSARVSAANWVFPETYGALRNDVADDAPAFVLALATGRCVRLTEGTYKIASTLTLPQKGCILGPSLGTTTIHYTGSGSAIVGSGLPIYDLLLSDFTLKGNDAGIGLALTSSWYGEFVRLEIQHFATAVDGVSVIHNKFTGGKIFSNTKGIRLRTGSNNNEVIGTTLQFNTGGAVSIESASIKNTLRGGAIENNGNPAMSIVDSSDNVIDGTWFESNTTTNILIDSTGSAVTGNRIINIEEADSANINIVNCQNCFLLGNRLVGDLVIGAGVANTFIGQQSALGTVTDGGSGTIFWHNAVSGGEAVWYLKTGTAKRFEVSVGSVRTEIKSDSGTAMSHVGDSGGLYRSGLTTGSLRMGTGSPEAVTTAPVGSMYLRTEATPGWYFKNSGSGNTGWLRTGYEKYTVTKIANGVSGCATAKGCWQVNAGTPVAAATATTQTVDWFAAPAGSVLERLRLKTATACTTLTAIQITEIGTSASTTEFAGGLTYDLKAAVSNTNLLWPAISTPGLTAGGTNWKVTISAGAENVDDIPDGCSFVIHARLEVLP